MGCLLEKAGERINKAQFKVRESCIFSMKKKFLLQKSNLKQQQQPVTLAAQPEPPAPMKKPAQVADMSKFLFDDGEQPHRLQSGPLYIKVEI